MPQQQEYLPMSLVTYSRAKGESIHLLYTKGFENGPGIYRDGRGSPWMIDRESQTRKITDPLEQRKGTWLVNEDARKLALDSLPRWKQDLKAQEKHGLIEAGDASQRLKYYDEFEKSIPVLPDYHSIFSDTYPGREIVGMQGSGNLSMNEWYVAYLRSPFTDDEPVFIALAEDQVGDAVGRQYTCLLKYRDGHVSIEPVTFNFYRKRVCRVSDQKEITGDLEFAVYGTQLLRDGELVDLSGVVEQIADVRHLFRLPNLNPKASTKNDPKSRPRRFFGEKQYDDVWFGEAELLDNVNTRSRALTDAVLLDRQYQHMGADPDYVREMFEGQGYREDKLRDRFLRYSDGTWRLREETDQFVEVKLLRNVYAYSMIGVDADGNILTLAVGGLAGRRGQTLEAAVQNIRSYGAVNALLMDQGDDVFQYAVSPNGVYEPRVKLLRAQLRAVFVFASGGVAGPGAQGQAANAKP